MFALKIIFALRLHHPGFEFLEQNIGQNVLDKTKSYFETVRRVLSYLKAIDPLLVLTT